MHRQVIAAIALTVGVWIGSVILGFVRMGGQRLGSYLWTKFLLWLYPQYRHKDR